MKILLTFLSLIFTSSLAAQVFVDIDATGDDNGTSWEHAFTDLQDAFAVTPNGGIIWVAEGKYFPRVPDEWSNSFEKTFYIKQSIKLFGGFEGNEVVFEDRDWEAHPTILSGDFNEDDVLQNFNQNRSDNATNVILYDEVTDFSELNGFIVEHGHADASQVDFTGERGAGVFSYGAVQIRHCIFRENYADSFGGALYFKQDLCSGALVDDCLFEGNYSESSGGGVVVALVQTEPVTIRNSAFSNNKAELGGGAFYSNNSSSILEDNVFLDNLSLLWGGAARYQTDVGTEALTVVIDSCQFFNNQSSIGGGLSYSSRAPNNTISVSNSLFEGNMADLEIGPVGSFRGGGMNIEFLFETSGSVADIRNVIFRNNKAVDNGAGLSMLHENSNSTNIQFDIIDCLFEINEAQSSGGGFYYLNLGGKGLVEITGSNFFDNLAANEGGAIHIEPQVDANNIEIDACRFAANMANVASAIALHPAEDINVPIEHTMEVRNCLFSHHLGSSLIEVESMPLQLYNCTLADNETTVGLLAKTHAKCFLQNNLFLGLGDENVKLQSDGFIGSLGGNLLNDFSFSISAITQDFLGEEPTFETGTYQLSLDSKGVDQGVLPEDPSLYDLAGSPRIQGGCIDIGAYESPYDSGLECGGVSTSTVETANMESGLTCFPNPVQETLNVVFEGPLNTETYLEVLNANGQSVLQQQMKQSNTELPVQRLTPGVYTIRIQNADSYVTSRFIKI